MSAIVGSYGYPLADVICATRSRERSGSPRQLRDVAAYRRKRRFQKKARREEFSGQGGFRWSRRQTLPREGVPDKTSDGAKNLKDAACCRNAFGQLLQCGLLRVRLIAAPLVLRFARRRPLARKPVVSELGSKRFHRDASTLDNVTCAYLFQKQATCHPVVEAESVRLTTAFAVLSGKIDAAIAQNKMAAEPAIVVIRRRLLLQLCYLADPQ